MTIIEERANLPLTLKAGKHSTPDDGMCLVEAASWIAGEPFSDHPKCVCPVLAAFGRSWNDTLDDDARNRLLLPFVPLLVGTRSTPAVESRRAWMATDWAIRVSAPAWLRLAGMTVHADALASLAEVTAANVASAAQPLLDAARDAAGVAARDAAWVAAWIAAHGAEWVAAWTAAWVEAGNAPRVAAWAAAWAAAEVAAQPLLDAARFAARDAARDAVQDAARVAVRVAARDALAPTVTELQTSAVDLFHRMIEVS